VPNGHESSKAERFGEFLRRVASAAAVTTYDQAYKLICTTLNQVEDEMTSIPYNPSNWMTDGRMYPPQADSVRLDKEYPCVKRLRSLRHNTYIGENGSIEIRTIDGDVICAKPGADGQGVWES
jgi:hypothetical protein